MSGAFPGKTVDEVKMYTFDFRDELPSGASIIYGTVEKSVHSGNDPAAAGFALQIATWDTPYVMAMGYDGIEGATYKLRARAEDDRGQTHVIWAYAAIKESAAKAT